MAFQQLYYTSCETGLAGFGGYQFNAVTPGTSPVIMREVEGRSIYEPPRWLLADPCPDEPEAYPTAFSYAKSEAATAVILTHVKFAGNDYSGRPGNYFAHALVTSSPERDLAPLLPVELWGAEVWKGTAIEANTLPELPGPLARGVIDRDGVQRFLEARGTERMLPELLTAAWRAMAGDRLVLLSSNDPDENIWWIAAISYLSGEHLSAELTFTTYSHRPGYSRHHLIGIQAESVPPDAEAGFQLFDLDEGRTPGGAPHPLAALLADAGVPGSERLWRQAAAFASGTEAGPDDWLGPVATATGLLRGQLSASETQAVADWLSGAAGRIPPQHATIALGVVLEGQQTALADEQVESLLGLVRRIGTSVQAEQLERLLVERVVAHIGRGEPAATPQLGPAGAEAAQAAVTELLLGTTEPAVAVTALEWAAAYQALPADAWLEEYGHIRLPSYGGRPEVIRILRSHPAARRGFVAWLAGQPRASARRVLATVGGEPVTDRDLAAYPGLAEEWQLILAENRRIPPEHAFDLIRDIRRDAQLSPYADAALLGRLWPGGCPPAQVAELLDVLADPPAPDVRDWFVTQIRAAAEQSTKSPGWQALTKAFAGNAALLQQLPAELAEAVQRKVSATQTWQRGLDRISRGDLGAFADLYADHNALPKGQEKIYSAMELAEEIQRTSPLDRALRDCPPDVLDAFFLRAEQRLNAMNRDFRFAERVFLALGQPGMPPEVADRLWFAFDQVADWKRHDRNYLGKVLAKSHPRAYEVFKDWLDSRSKPLIPKPQFPKKLFGGDPRGSAEDR